MSIMPYGRCVKCNKIFFATPGYFELIGYVCAKCAGVPEDEIIEEEDGARAGY
ncbi:MAG: hypothetical protein ACWGQW_02395 [bacterium]